MYFKMFCIGMQMHAKPFENGRIKCIEIKSFDMDGITISCKWSDAVLGWVFTCQKEIKILENR